MDTGCVLCEVGNKYLNILRRIRCWLRNKEKCLCLFMNTRNKNKVRCIFLVHSAIKRCRHNKEMNNDVIFNH